MNEQYKKDLTQAYKRNELEADASSSNAFLSSFAKRQLGTVSEPCV